MNFRKFPLVVLTLVMILILPLPLVSAFAVVPSLTPGLDDKCIRSVAQIQCNLSPELDWSCVQPNVVLVKNDFVDKVNVSENHRHVNLANKDQGQHQDGHPKLLVNCTAPFPIDVRVSGFQVVESFRTLYVRNAENVFNEATFVYSVGVRYKPFSRVRTLTVFKLTDESAAVSFSVFHLGDSGANLSTGEIVMEQSPGDMNIPCISPDPSQTPDLVHVSQGNAPRVEFEYDILRGFRTKNATALSTNSTEIYDCFLMGRIRADKSMANANIRFKIEPRKALHVYPPFHRIILFGNDDLHIACGSHRKVQLTGNFRGESIRAKTTVESEEFTSTLEQRSVQVGDVGYVQCVDDDTKQVIFSWDIVTLDIENNNVLRVTKSLENLVSCVSSIETVPRPSSHYLMAVFCQGETNCEAKKYCLEPGANCSNVRLGTICQGPGEICLPMNKNDPNLSQGMIHCRAGNYSYTTKFFLGFDGILYLDWRRAPVSALIEVFVPPENVTMYPHNSYPFGCRASPFISDGRIQWVIRGKDGSEILLHKNRVKDISPTYNLDTNLYTVRESNIRLIYPNDYDVLCMVPLWNATGSLRYHKRINVAAHVAPVKEILIASSCIIILLIIPLVIVILRLRKAREAIRNLTEQEVEQFIKGDPSALNSKDKDAHEIITATPYNQNFEIPRNKLLIDTENKLGEGTFGLVLKGKVEGMSDVVAVKTVKPRCEVDQFKGFLSELKIMMYIGKHPFVVALIGAHTDKIREKIMYIVVEYCSNGSLDKLLLLSKNKFVNQVEEGNRINPSIVQVPALYGNVSNSNNSGKPGNSDNVDLKTVDLLRWAYQIATGMDYLASKKVVHADLAARNVLIHENGVAKITDFGLSRQLMNYTQYVKKHQEPLPWRWMAEESLRNLAFSTHSDVWAFGVTLWEMFSLGDVPYPGLSWTIAFLDNLASGLRMTKPSLAPTFMYDMMLRCWHQIPNNRPSFGELASQFKKILDSLDINVEVSIPPTQPINTGIIHNIATNKRNTVANLYENEI